MESKRDPKYGKVLKCSNENCRKEAYNFEAMEWWTIHKGQHFCFKCSVDNPEIDFKNQFMTFRVEELNKRKKRGKNL